MKFRDYLALVRDPDGFIPSGHLRWIIRKNPRSTAREEAIAAKVIRQANPRENISGTLPWGPEEQFVLQQAWIHPAGTVEWRDVLTKGAKDLFTVESTESGDLPVPNAIREPGTIRGDFTERIRELLGDTE